MKTIILLCALLGIIQAQRPSYASSGPIGRPGLADRFKQDNPSSSSTASPVNFENRVGENNTTQKIPVDARGDEELVDRLNTWDRDHRPFWLLNADHIEKARNTTRGPQSNTPSPNTQTTNTLTSNSQASNVQTSNIDATQLANRNQIDSQLNQDKRRPQEGQNVFLPNEQGLIGQGGTYNQQVFPPRNQNSLPSSDVKYIRYPIRQEDPFNRYPIGGDLQHIPQRFPYEDLNFNRPRHFDDARRERFQQNRQYFF